MALRNAGTGNDVVVAAAVAAAVSVQYEGAEGLWMGLVVDISP